MSDWGGIRSHEQAYDPWVLCVALDDSDKPTEVLDPVRAFSWRVGKRVR